MTELLISAIQVSDSRRRGALCRDVGVEGGEHGFSTFAELRCLLVRGDARFYVCDTTGVEAACVDLLLDAAVRGKVGVLFCEPEDSRGILEERISNRFSAVAYGPSEVKPLARVLLNRVWRSPIYDNRDVDCWHPRVSFREERGRTSAVLVAKFFGISNREMCSILGLSHSALSACPAPKQPRCVKHLRLFERVARQARTFAHRSEFLEWLTELVDGGGPTPMDLLRQGDEKGIERVLKERQSAQRFLQTGDCSSFDSEEPF